MLKEAHAISEELIEWRRDFHMHPEIGFELHRTSKIVADELEKMGYRVKRGVGKTGVVAEIGEGGKMIAIGLGKRAQAESILPSISAATAKTETNGSNPADRAAANTTPVQWRIEITPWLTSMPSPSATRAPSAAIASAVEFLLEGLHLSKRLNKDAQAGRATYRARSNVVLTRTFSKASTPCSWHAVASSRQWFTSLSFSDPAMIDATRTLSGKAVLIRRSLGSHQSSGLSEISSQFHDEWSAVLGRFSIDMR